MRVLRFRGVRIRRFEIRCQCDAVIPPRKAGQTGEDRPDSGEVLMGIGW